MEKIAIIAMLIVVVNSESLTMFDVFPANGEQLRQLKFFGNTIHAFFASPAWYMDPMEPINILLPTETEEILTEYLICREMIFNIVSRSNDESVMKYMYPRLSQKKDLQNSNINFETYHRHDVMNLYLQDLALIYPELVTLEKAGESSEGRDLIAIKISSGGNGTKPLMFIEAGIHAREWIASAQALYIVQQLLENSARRYLIDNVDWLVLPVVNPDGYEFTHKVTKEWRKTRSKGINCIGVDANRNFDFNWGKIGVSLNECHDRYPGPRPFSEPESRALRDLILKYSHRIKLYLSFHSLGQFILYPWGHSYVPHRNVVELDSLGKRVALAIERFSGSQYSVGSISRMMYLTSGDSISWAAGVAGIDLAFIMELPPKLHHYPPKVVVNGDIPPHCVKLVVEETFQGVKVFHDHVEKKYAVN